MNQHPHQGPAPEVLAQLRSWGSRANMPEVKAFYSQRLAGQDRTGISVACDQPYGPHPRQQMDVYFPQTPGKDRPVLLFLHGGGFIRGDKADRANLGWWGARQGFVTVLANYRLAPEVNWPAGAQDVVTACQHLHEICRGSKLHAGIRFDALPILSAAKHLAQDGYATGASDRNWTSVGPHVQLPAGAPEWHKKMLTDPQTSGGLLVACDRASAQRVLEIFKQQGFNYACEIGALQVGPPTISVS